MITKRFIIYIGVILISIACNGVKPPEKPKDLISKDKMVDILIDAKIISTATSANRKKMEARGVNLDTYVFTKHGIDSLQFTLSNDYYAYHIEDYEAIYAKVEDSLKTLKAALKIQKADEWKEKTKNEEDSLKIEFSDLDPEDLPKLDVAIKKLKKDSIIKSIPEDRKLIIPVSSK